MDRSKVHVPFITIGELLEMSEPDLDSVDAWAIIFQGSIAIKQYLARLETTEPVLIYQLHPNYLHLLGDGQATFVPASQGDRNIIVCETLKEAEQFLLRSLGSCMVQIISRLCATGCVIDLELNRIIEMMLDRNYCGLDAAYLTKVAEAHPQSLLFPRRIKMMLRPMYRISERSNHSYPVTHLPDYQSETNGDSSDALGDGNHTLQPSVAVDSQYPVKPSMSNCEDSIEPQSVQVLSSASAVDTRELPNTENVSSMISNPCGVVQHPDCLLDELYATVTAPSSGLVHYMSNPNISGRQDVRCELAPSLSDTDVTSSPTIKGPDFVIVPLNPEEAFIHLGEPRLGPLPSNHRLVRIVLTNNQQLVAPVEVNSLVAQLFQRVADCVSIQQAHLIGLCTIEDGECHFLDHNRKLWNYAPPGWKDKNYHKVKADFVLHFRVKIFDQLRSFRSPELRSLLYNQLRQDILSGALFCDDDTAFLLGSYAVQAELGRTNCQQLFQTSQHTSIKHYLPERLVRRWNEIDAVRKITSKVEQKRSSLKTDFRYMFLAECQKLPHYGYHFHKVSRSKKDMKDSVLLGIGISGLSVFESRGELKLPLLLLPWSDVKKFFFKKKKIVLELKKGQDITSLKFYTDSTKRSEYLLWFCELCHHQYVYKETLGVPKPGESDAWSEAERVDISKVDYESFASSSTASGCLPEVSKAVSMPTRTPSSSTSASSVHRSRPESQLPNQHQTSSFSAALADSRSTDCTSHSDNPSGILSGSHGSKVLGTYSAVWNASTGTNMSCNSCLSRNQTEEHGVPTTLIDTDQPTVVPAVLKVSSAHPTGWGIQPESQGLDLLQNFKRSVHEKPGLLYNVALKRGKHGYGLNLASDHAGLVYVKSLSPGRVSNQVEQISVGDRLVCINSRSVIGASALDVVHTLRTLDEVLLEFFRWNDSDFVLSSRQDLQRTGPEDHFGYQAPPSLTPKGTQYISANPSGPLQHPHSLEELTSEHLGILSVQQSVSLNPPTRSTSAGNLSLSEGEFPLTSSGIIIAAANRPEPALSSLSLSLSKAGITSGASFTDDTLNLSCSVSDDNELPSLTLDSSSSSSNALKGREQLLFGKPPQGSVPTLVLPISSKTEDETDLSHTHNFETASRSLPDICVHDQPPCSTSRTSAGSSPRIASPQSLSLPWDGRSFEESYLTSLARALEIKLASPLVHSESKLLSELSSSKSTKLAARLENRSKNRSKHSVPYDENCVMVMSGPGTSYINASLVKIVSGARTCLYIAAQAPLPSGVDDFLQLVWEKQTPVVVMLTSEQENRKNNCACYLPSCQALPKKTARFRLELIMEREDKYTRTQQLVLHNISLEKELQVEHFHFKHMDELNDTDVLSGLIHLIDLVASQKKRGTKIVHCCNGDTRTGLYLFLDLFLPLLRRCEQFDTYDLLSALKQCRNSFLSSQEDLRRYYVTLASVIQLLLLQTSQPPR